MTVRDHVSLRDVVWFQTGGVAHYYAACDHIADIKEAVAFAKQEKVTYCVIGKGTHLLVSDSGYPGIVIQNQTRGLVFLHDKSQVLVDAGFPVAQLVAQTMSQGYSGLEFLAGLPGTVGGAVYHNQEVAGYQIGQYVRQATLLNVTEESDTMISVDRDWFAFRPHGCILQDNKTTHPPILLTVTLQLSKMNHESCVHKLQQLQPQKPVLPTQPYLMVFDRLRLATTKQLAPKKIAEFLPPITVEPTQLRSWLSNDIKVSPQNPNCIMNTNIGTSRDAAMVIEKMQTDLADPTLEPLIEYMGLWE